MDSDAPKIVFNIDGGNNRILLNVTMTEQHFYGNRYVELALSDLPVRLSEPSDSETRLCIHINVSVVI